MSTNKSTVSSNCSGINKHFKPEEKCLKKSIESNNTAQSTSQIIEDNESATENLDECIEDVSYLFFHFSSFYYLYRSETTYTSMNKIYIAAIYHRF